MKKLTLLLVLGLLGFAACKKDKSEVDYFGPLTLADIKAKEVNLSATEIVVTTEAGVDLLKPGAIIFYKNNDGNFGKMKLVSIGKASPDYLLTIDLVNYNADGTILLEKKNVPIRNGYYVDLVLGQEADGTLEDFAWQNPVPGKFILNPANAALFYTYSSSN